MVGRLCAWLLNLRRCSALVERLWTWLLDLWRCRALTCRLRRRLMILDGLGRRCCARRLGRRLIRLRLLGCSCSARRRWVLGRRLLIHRSRRRRSTRSLLRWLLGLCSLWSRGIIVRLWWRWLRVGLHWYWGRDRAWRVGRWLRVNLLLLLLGWLWSRNSTGRLRRRLR